MSYDTIRQFLSTISQRCSIDEDREQYSLFIVYGGQERCVRLDERPMVLFKKIERKGRKPMFVIRRTHPLINYGGQ